MIDALVPCGVEAVETFGDLAGDGLFPEEESSVVNAVPARRREFTTARLCARQALARLGRAPVAIPVGSRREPCWPAGVVGSITHCSGYRAAAVATTATAASIGIDAERHGPLPDGLLDAIAVAADRDELERVVGACPAIHWDTMLFSAKESVYKAWYPLTRRSLDFKEVTVHFDVPTRSFAAQLAVKNRHGLGATPCPSRMTGRWMVERDVIVTATVVPPVRGDEAYVPTV